MGSIRVSVRNFVAGRLCCACHGPLTVRCPGCACNTGLSQGAHSLQARASLADGTTDQTPLTFDWIVDTIAPVVSFYSTPPAVSSAPSGAAVFVFTASEADITLQYSYVNVTSPTNTSSLSSLFNSSMPWTSTLRYGMTIANLTSTCALGESWWCERCSLMALS